MELEQREGSDNALANGNTSSAKRGRGRPRGSVNKKIVSVMEEAQNVRKSKRVDFFSPDTVLKPKVRKRGRPKKIRIPGRPRKIPLTPEEEAERILKLSRQRKRRLSKPLGRPRIHPLVDIPKEKRGRGRPRKYEPLARASSQNSTVNGNLRKKFTGISKLGENSPRKRGRPPGSFKKKRGPPADRRAIQGTPGKRGRPPGSGSKMTAKHKANGTPQKRGRPPGSGSKLQIITQKADGTPRKRGRPPGSGTKIKFAVQVTGGIPRKRGRPPGSGNKIKVPPRGENGTPRKRGRPLGSGKVKTVLQDTQEGDHSSRNAFTTSSKPRKRGRPSKAGLAKAFSEAMEEQSELNDVPLSKRPRDSFASSSSEEAETMADAQENNTMMATSILVAEGRSEHVEETSVHDVILIGNESHNRKSASPRVAGKSQKRK